jgi:hypothetical protein
MKLESKRPGGRRRNPAPDFGGCVVQFMMIVVSIILIIFIING